MPSQLYLMHGPTVAASLKLLPSGGTGGAESSAGGTESSGRANFFGRISLSCEWKYIFFHWKMDEYYIAALYSHRENMFALNEDFLNWIELNWCKSIDERWSCFELSISFFSPGNKLWHH